MKNFCEILRNMCIHIIRIHTYNIKINLCHVSTVDGTFHKEERIYPDVETSEPITTAKKWIKSYN